MIADDPDRAFAMLAERLTRRAAALAEARRLQRRGDPMRWRRPALLWPLFAERAG